MVKQLRAGTRQQCVAGVDRPKKRRILGQMRARSIAAIEAYHRTTMTEKPEGATAGLIENQRVVRDLDVA